jgi:hypothetical protein
MHVPQLVTVRETPQLSGAVTLPHVLPRREQNAGLDSFMQPQTFVILAPPHVWGAAQVPQLVTVRIVPQLSGAVTLPQFLESRVQNAALISGMHPQTLAVPSPPQVWGVVQVPQLVTVRIVPQLSGAVTLPQFFFTRVQNTGSVSATQLGPHTLATPPPMQVIGDGHVPQLVAVRIAPQLSVPVKDPQLLPSREQKVASDSGVHMLPQTPTVPPPPHVAGAVHVPQLATLRIAPQLSCAITPPHVLPRRPHRAGSDSGEQLSIEPASDDEPPTPAPDEPPVVVAGEPPEPLPVPALDVFPVVALVLPAPPVPAVTGPGPEPAAPVGPGPTPVVVSSPGASPSTPCAQEANPTATNTSATR